MNVKDAKRAALVLVCVTSFVFAEAFTWNGNGPSRDWDDSGNWASIGPPWGPYPWEDDDAIIPSGNWTVDLIDFPTIDMDDLTIRGSVDFIDSDEVEPILKAESVTIGADKFLTVTIVDAKIETTS